MSDWLRGLSLAAVAFGIPFFFARKTDVASCAFLVAVACLWFAHGVGK